jgi:hypoxanthine phosphoribosyltransferase
MSNNQQSNLKSQANDLNYWKSPTGVEVPRDRLQFLYIPDEAEHMMISWLAKQVFAYQQRHAGTERQITKMIMITMGALLPGVLLHDYITYGASKDMPPVEFGTFGVKYYYGPGQPLTAPEIVQPLSIDVRGHNVGIVEDLVDLGGTAKFVRNLLRSDTYGARDTLLIAPFRKSATGALDMEAITYSRVPSDTWIITPRERVETMMKRVPYWRQQGTSKDECRQNLADIGYSPYLVDEWFEVAWARA